MNLADIVAVAASRPREIVIVRHIREIIVRIVLSRNVQSRKCEYEESEGPHTADRWTVAFSVGRVLAAANIVVRHKRDGGIY